MIMTYLRHIHGYPDDHKIAFIKKGSECLYPSVTEFIYDWEDAPDDQKNWRLFKSRNHYRYMCGLRNKIKRQYPAANIIYPTFNLPNERAWNYIPEPTIRRGLLTDIVIAPRYRQYGASRNFKYWQELINTFNQMGYSVGAIGAPDTSILNLTGLAYRSWEYDFLNAGIELLRNCKLAVMSCSGPAHLATLCGTPLKVIYNEPGWAADGRGKWYMDEMQKFATVHCEPILYGWHNPEVIYEAVQLYFKNHQPN